MAANSPLLDRLALRARALRKPFVSWLGERFSPVYRGKTRRADVLICWFPKTGGTWSRLLLHTALSKHFGVEGVAELDFDGLSDREPRIPRIRAFHEDEPHWKRPEALATSKARYADKKVIVLGRDPRDAMVSLYFQMTKRFRVLDPSTPMNDFIWQEKGALKTWVRYHNIWARNREAPKGFMLVRYEDVHEDPAEMLRKMLAFIGVEGVSEAIIAESVGYNDIEALRARELAGKHSHHQLRPGIAGDPDSFKARRGKLGGYKDYLTQEEIDAIERYVDAELDPLYGYVMRSEGEASP